MRTAQKFSGELRSNSFISQNFIESYFAKKICQQEFLISFKKIRLFPSKWQDNLNHNLRSKTMISLHQEKEKKVVILSTWKKEQQK